jgi:hypothetical protein
MVINVSKHYAVWAYRESGFKASHIFHYSYISTTVNFAVLATYPQIHTGQEDG